MTNPYVEIFRAPGAVGFAAAGFLARLPLAMVTIGIVAMLSQTTGRYGLAGAVAATFAVTNAVISPRISRLVDRHGQSRVLIPATIVSVVAFLALCLNTRLAGPDGLLFVFALVAGVMPSMPAMVRARWTELYRGTPRLHTAFAFESILDELIYMSGSVLAIGLSLSLFPEAGPLAAALILAVGTALFVVQKSTEPPPRPAEPANMGSAIRYPAVLTLTVALAAVGAIFGTAEVTVIAFAEALGNKAAASWVLAIYASGSLTVGIVYGTLRLSTPLSRQFLVFIAIVTITTIPPLLVSSIPALALVLFLAGGAISPTFITAFGLIQRLVPSSQLTEGITWGMTGIGIGMAVGSIASGYVIDAFGAQSGFWISVAAGVVAIAAAVIGSRTLRVPVVAAPASPAVGASVPGRS